MILLEREEQLGALRAHLDDARAGRGCVVTLSGEAGAGKTALLEAFVAEIGDGARVLRGACEDFSIPDPLGPLYDLARDAHWPLSRISGERHDRLPVFSEALGMFEDASRPTVLVIEDLHWADDATLDLVRFLGRRITTRHILLLITARNDAADGQKRLRRAVGDLPPMSVSRLDVPLLTEAAVKTLASRAGRDSDAIYRASAGNAFFVTELLGTSGEVPPSVRDATLSRAERLSPGARQALDTVAIFPRRAESEILRALMGEGSEASLSECVDLGMLEQSGGAYAFRHEIARHAIEAALSVYLRHDLNTRALAALRGLSGVSNARLAHHAVEARDSAAVRELAPRAAYEASRIGAHREAAGHYEAMLRLVDGFDPEEQAIIYARFAFECHLIGRIREAVEAQIKARAIYRDLGDLAMEGDTIRWLSRLSYLKGDRVSAESFGAEAVALLETQPPGPELAMAYSNLSHLAMLADRFDDALALGKSAIAIGEVMGRPDIVSHALNNTGSTKSWLDHAAGRADLDRSLEIALTHNYQEHAARTYTNRACFEVNILAYRQARAVLENGICYCLDRDLDTWHYYMQGWLADVLIKQGCWDEAGEAALPVVADENATPLMRFTAVCSLARLRLRRGDPAVDGLIAEIRRFVETAMELQRVVLFAGLLAERAWLGLGDRQEALDWLARADAMAPNRALFGEIAVWIRRLDPRADLGDLTTLAAPWRAELEGDWRRAAALWNEIGAPFDEAMAMLGGDEAAQRKALSIFEDLGAVPVADRARAHMRQNGISRVAKGPRQSTRANAMGLTQREMQVLGFVARGLSSKRIAAELAISPKTVDHHVGAMLEKLGAHTRTEATVAARDAGLI